MCEYVYRVLEFSTCQRRNEIILGVIILYRAFTPREFFVCVSVLCSLHPELRLYVPRITLHKKSARESERDIDEKRAAT